MMTSCLNLNSYKVFNNRRSLKGSNRLSPFFQVYRSWRSLWNANLNIPPLCFKTSLAPHYILIAAPHSKLPTDWTTFSSSCNKVSLPLSLCTHPVPSSWKPLPTPTLVIQTSAQVSLIYPRKSSINLLLLVRCRYTLPQQPLFTIICR